MRRLALVLSLCVTSMACRTARIERVVDAAVAQAVAEHRYSGVVLVARDGRPLFAKAYGRADHKPSTPFMIMSVSKQFTAALIMRLVAQGKLRLDDPVHRYLDDWPEEWRGVEIRHLLSHTAGLDIDTTYFWLVANHPEYWPESTAPPRYEPRAPLAAPGEKYTYANVGYTLLSMIAAKAGGRPFDELLRAEVFAPLGLAHTTQERNGVRVPGRARGYTRTNDGLALNEQKTIDIVGAGDVVSNAFDLARFDAAFDDDRFLPRELREAMLTPRAERAPGVHAGYGWFLRTSAGGRALQYHTGAGAGFRAFNYRLPDAHLAVVVLSNIDEAEQPWIAPLLDRIADEMKRRP